jgi:hypothetical protein
VLRPWISDDPSGNPGIQGRGVGEQLAKIIVIAAAELILDPDDVAGQVFGPEIDAEGSDRMLSLYADERYADGPLRTSGLSASQVVKSAASSRQTSRSWSRVNLPICIPIFPECSTPGA